MAVVDVIKDLVWANIHGQVHGEFKEFKSLHDTQVMMYDLKDREKDGKLNPLDLSKPVLSAYSFFKKHLAFIND
jgi:hypothetical protein